jgi:hypothetical protein
MSCIGIVHWNTFYIQGALDDLSRPAARSVLSCPEYGLGAQATPVLELTLTDPLS